MAWLEAELDRAGAPYSCKALQHQCPTAAPTTARPLAPTVAPARSCKALQLQGPSAAPTVARPLACPPAYSCTPWRLRLHSACQGPCRALPPCHPVPLSAVRPPPLTPQVTSKLRRDKATSRGGVRRGRQHTHTWTTTAATLCRPDERTHVETKSEQSPNKAHKAAAVALASQAGSTRTSWQRTASRSAPPPARAGHRRALNPLRAPKPCSLHPPAGPHFLCSLAPRVMQAAPAAATHAPAL